MRLIARITNALFGWHWIEVEYAGDVIRRIRTAPNGRRYIRILGHTFDVHPDGTVSSPSAYGGTRPYRPYTFVLADQ